MTNEQKPEKKIRIAIIDIDGCLSDDSRRRKFLPSDSVPVADRDFEPYHRGCDNDPVLGYGHNVVKEWHTDFVVNSTRADEEGIIIFMTARPERHRTPTYQWLVNKVGVDFHQRLTHQGFDGEKRPPAFMLLMRDNDDKRKSTETKRAMLLDLVTLLNNAYGYDCVDVRAAYDDRADIIHMWRSMGIPAFVCDANGIHGAADPGIDRTPATIYPMPLASFAVPSSIPSEIEEITANLRAMADTLDSRAADYGYNAGMVAQMMSVMFPKGVTLTTSADFEFWHLFELQIVKLTRFVNSGLKHKDSVHDGAIYAAFCERLIDKHDIKINK